MINPSADWYQTAVFYEIFVRSFHDSNKDGWGDLPGVTAKLDYLKWLGVDCIWLLPFFASPMRDGGYDISDFYQIHPQYGTLEDFKILIKEAHARNIRVIGDLVLNHTSVQHPWFQEARQPNSSKRDWYVWSDTTEKYKGVRVVFTDFEDSNWEWDDMAKAYYWHRFFREQPDLNYDNPEVQEEMLKVARYWLELGLDGFRLDAVPHLVEREGTSCENLPETHQFLRRLRHEVSLVNPEAVLLAETNQKPDDLLDYFNNDDECHMAFHFPAMVEIFDALRTANSSSLSTVLATIPALPPHCAWGTFLRNHDELSPRHLPPDTREAFIQHYAPTPEARFKIGPRRRLAPMLNHDPAQIKLAYSILLAIPGTPVLYYGDELGMTDELTLPDRDSLRTPMPWTAKPGAGFSQASTEQWHLPLAANWQDCNVELLQAMPDSLPNWLRTALAFRSVHPALQTGDVAVIETDNTALLAFTRSHPTETLLFIANLSALPQIIEIPDRAQQLWGTKIAGTTLPAYETALWALAPQPVAATI